MQQTNRHPGATTPPSRRSQPTKSHCPCIPSTWTHGKGKQTSPSVASVIVTPPLPPHPHNPPPFSPHPVTPPPKTLILPVVQTHTLSLPRYPSEAHRRSSSFPAVGSVTGVAQGMTHCSAARPAGHTEWAGYIFAGSHDTLKQTGEEIL